MPEQSDQNPHRLPRTVVPRRYDLTLEPDLASASFTGTVAINVEVVEATMTMVLNAAELEIDEAWVERDDGRRVDAKVALDEEAERATLTLGHTLFAGAATVHLSFRGTLNDKLVGFYRSTFTDDAGNEQVLAATQMQATHARRAFPCWDEPDLKAAFGVTMVVPKDLFAVSNGAELYRQDRGDGKVEVVFADTIPMSTYLVAFVVGPLEATEPVDVDGVPLRVVHPPGRGHLAPFALEVGAFCLRYFTDWFDIPYMGGKVDLVAIPDFAFGAMENLGCVTFRERYVLIDPETTTQSERQAVVDVIAHELAHMWFGDLVTMKWWNGIWLNEAFATFMEMKATDTFRPDWHRWVDFGLSRSSAFDTDSLAATRPIEFPVVSPDEAEGMFDVLTYEKGASVVRMLEQYLGSDRFRDGLRRYMATHQFGNTETTDLWDALEEETGEPVRRIADSWIFQGGFPEVTVETVAPDTLRFSQRRFAYDTEAVVAAETGNGKGRAGTVPSAVEVAAVAEGAAVVDSSAAAVAAAGGDTEAAAEDSESGDGDDGKPGEGDAGAAATGAAGEGESDAGAAATGAAGEGEDKGGDKGDDGDPAAGEGEGKDEGAAGAASGAVDEGKDEGIAGAASGAVDEGEGDAGAAGGAAGEGEDTGEAVAGEGDTEAADAGGTGAGSETAAAGAAGGENGSGGRGGGPSRWAVPLVVDARSDSAMEVRRLLLDDASLDLTVPGTVDWVNANLGASGFYRVVYSDTLRERLIERRRYLSPLERYILVDDTWAAVLAGSVDAAAFLALAERFTDETDLSVWERLLSGLETLERLVPVPEAGGPFAEKVRAIVAPAYERLGVEPEDDENDRTRTLRGLLLGTLALVGNDESAQALCASRLDTYLGDPEAQLDPDLASAALTVSAALGDQALHERLVERFEATTNPQDRERVLFALGGFRDADCFARTLELSLSGKVRTQDAPYLLREAIANRANGVAAWDFVAGHWDDITSRFPTNSIPRLVAGIRALRERSVAERVVAFLAEHPVPQGELQVRQHVERMWVTVRLAEREGERFAAALT